MKQIHTHRGHCQLCASVQAIDVNTGIVAKHGYTVRGGYFSGTCPGSDVMNLHVSRDLADKHIADARAEVARLTPIRNAYEAKTAHPSHVWGGEYDYVRPIMRKNAERNYSYGVTGWGRNVHAPWTELDQQERKVEWADADAHHQELGRKRAIASIDGRISQCTEYANTLEYWANRVTGKVDPYQKKDLEPRDWKQGDTVQIGGKKGFSAVIEAVEKQEYSTFGFRRGRGTVMCDHGRVTRPAVTEKRVSEKAGGYVIRDARPAAVLWVALRDIKRAPNPLAEELKKAGLL